MTKTVTVLLFVAAYGVAANAQEPPCERRMPPDSGYCYTSALIHALEVAHDAALTPIDTSEARRARDDQDKVVILATAAFVRSAKQRMGVEIASSRLEPFRSARDSLVRESATSILTGLSGLLSWFRSADSTLKAGLDARPAGGAGTQAATMAGLQLRRNSAAKLVIMGVIAGTYALIDNSSPAGKRTLLLTATQRVELLDEARTAFPGALKAAQNGQWPTDYAAAASMLEKFLQEWPARR